MRLRVAGVAVGLASELGEQGALGQAGDDRLDDRIAGGAGPGGAARAEVSQLLEPLSVGWWPLAKA
jgi:hypothetical protein